VTRAQTRYPPLTPENAQSDLVMRAISGVVVCDSAHWAPPPEKAQGDLVMIARATSGVRESAGRVPAIVKANRPCQSQ
jgi:hypothetical protein